ncbi:MAG: phage holin family protein [Candidatus Saccharimonadales bacterium]
MKKQLLTFIVRWFANTLALWLSASIFGLVDKSASIETLAIGGFILAILNAIIKPLLIIFTLPAIALTLGFFLIVINGVVVWLASLLYQPLNIDSFWAAVLVGIVIGLVNYMVTIIAEAIAKQHA